MRICTFCIFSGEIFSRYPQSCHHQELFKEEYISMRNSSIGTSSTPNRWLIAIAAFIVQLALGSVYAWSVFLAPVMKTYSVSKPAASLTFTITLIALGVTA